MRSQTQNKLFIGNLSFSATEEDIRTAFAAYGDVVEIHRPVDRDTGRPKGFAFVTMETQSEAQNALKLDGAEINGRQVRVSMAESKQRTGGSEGRGRSGGNGGGRGRY